MHQGSCTSSLRASAMFVDHRIEAVDVDIPDVAETLVLLLALSLSDTAAVRDKGDRVG